MSSFLSLKQVQARTTLSRSTIYRKIAEGAFPSQFSITHSRVVWSEDDIENWMEERKAQPILREVYLSKNNGEV